MITNYKFHGQHPDEQVVAVFKRHPWSYFKSVIKLLVFLLIPWLVIMFFGFTIVFTYSVAIVGIVGLLWFFLLIYLWNSNIVILSNQRIMVVDLKTPINRQVTEVPLKNIQDSTFQSRGVVATMFGYGDIFLQTAGSGTEQIILKSLDAPYDIQQLISKTMH